MIRRLLLCFLLLCSFANAEDLLPPSVAFKPTARALDGQTIEVRFEIASPMAIAEKLDEFYRPENSIKVTIILRNLLLCFCPVERFFND